MNQAGIKKLAELSRLELNDSEITEYADEFSQILEYVDRLKGAVSTTDDTTDLVLEHTALRNVVRLDEKPNEPGVNTKKILDSAPETENDYLRVRKVL